MSVTYGTGGNILYLMDPLPGGLFDILKFNFDRHYNGNRAPMGVFLHYGPDRAAEVRVRLGTIANFIRDFGTTQQQSLAFSLSQIIKLLTG